MVKIIGDSSVMNLPHIKGNNIFIFKNSISLDSFLEQNLDFFKEKCKDDSVIVYSFGFNDKVVGRSNIDIISDYEKLPKGKNRTIIIIPQNQNWEFFEECNEFLSDDYIFITTLIEINNSRNILEDSDINNQLLNDITNKSIN